MLAQMSAVFCSCGVYYRCMLGVFRACTVLTRGAGELQYGRVYVQLQLVWAGRTCWQSPGWAWEWIASSPRASP